MVDDVLQYGLYLQRLLIKKEEAKVLTDGLE
jgi:hypothetical protein